MPDGSDNIIGSVPLSAPEVAENPPNGDQRSAYFVVWANRPNRLPARSMASGTKLLWPRATAAGSH